MKKQELRDYLLTHPALLQLLDDENYDLFFNTIPYEYVNTMVELLHELSITDKTCYTVWVKGNKKVQTKLTDWDKYDELTNWAKQNIGTQTYWYIANDENGEIVYINE